MRNHPNKGSLTLYRHIREIPSSHLSSPYSIDFTVSILDDLGQRKELMFPGGRRDSEEEFSFVPCSYGRGEIPLKFVNDYKA